MIMIAVKNMHYIRIWEEKMKNWGKYLVFIYSVIHITNIYVFQTQN